MPMPTWAILRLSCSPLDPTRRRLHTRSRGPMGWGEDGCVELRSAFIFSPVAPAKATGFCFWSLISRRGEDSDDNFIHHTEKDRKRREIPCTKEDSRPRLWQDGDHSAGVIS